MNMTKEDHIYRVSFRKQPIEGDPRTDFYFFSLAAIYESFTAEQIGCKVENLWKVGVSDGQPYEGRLCRITREPILRKTQKKNGSKEE